MIKRFSVLYVGQIDLDNVGSDGTPPDQRRYTNAQLAQAYEHAQKRWPSTWTSAASTACGWPNTTSSTKAMSASRT